MRIVWLKLVYRIILKLVGKVIIDGYMYGMILKILDYLWFFFLIKY